MLLHNIIVSYHCDYRYHHLYFDNYFSSIDLLLDLYKMGLYGCGTLRSNRKGFPADIKPFVKKGLSNRGDCVIRQCNDLTVSLWQDSKPVVTIASNSDPLNITSVLRKSKDGNRTEISCPQAIALYNKYMGGVDRNDQIRGYYPVRMKGRKFYRYIFWFIFDVAITNAYFLCRYHTSLTVNSVKKFRSELAWSLIGSFNNRKRRGRPSTSVTKRFCSSHFPKKGQRLRCQYCYHTKKERHETTWFCEDCKVPLCHSGLEDDCFLLFHKSM